MRPARALRAARRAVGALASVGILAWGSSLAQTDAASRSASAASSGPSIAWWLAIAAFGIAGWAVWRGQAALAGLHAARVHAQSLGDVLDVWQWQTDARHVLVSARPPSGAVEADWRLGTERQPLSALFRTGQAGELETRMSSAAPLDDVAVLRAVADGAPMRGTLRGRALVDETGRFAGYVGTVREHDVADAAAPSIVRRRP